MEQPVANALFFEDCCNNSIPFEYYITERKNYYENPNGFYNFYTTAVPRVSNILKETIYDEGLINWFKNCSSDVINKVSDNALLVGSIVHESIEKFIQLASNGIVFEFDSVVYDILKKNNYRLSDTLLKHTLRSYRNFTIWYTDMNTKGYVLDFLDIERPTVNPWYGGTIDAIVKITDKKTLISRTYILDFKTSKKISINYWLQVYAYSWSLNWEKINKCYTTNQEPPKIDGIGILRLPKSLNDITQFETLEFDIQEFDNITFILHQAFVSMINWYYHKRNIERELIH